MITYHCHLCNYTTQNKELYDHHCDNQYHKERAIILPLDDSGVIFTVESKGGKKNDQDKPDLSLIPREPLWELARVLMAGEKKYGRWNWQNGIDVHRLTSAAMRHITQFNDGETDDEETKTCHLLNASANLFFAYWMLKNKPEHDTRNKK